jgi:cytochrome c biogenesis protein CcmG/thiol:disulfide interchange protein DsbE
MAIACGFALAVGLGGRVGAQESGAAPAPKAAEPPQTQDIASKPTSEKSATLQGLRLVDLDGRSIDLGSYTGKGPLVLDFWATWCKPCQAAMPELVKLYADLRPRGLQIVGINEDGQRGAAKVKPFAQTQGLVFPVLLDLDSQAQSRLGVFALPTTLLLDAHGKIVHTSFGYRSGEIDALRAKIEALLAEKPHD